MVLSNCCICPCFVGLFHSCESWYRQAAMTLVPSMQFLKFIFSFYQNLKGQASIYTKFKPPQIVVQELKIIFMLQKKHDTTCHTTKISQTKCSKQSDNIFQFSFHCTFSCCDPFCLLCCPLGLLLLIGGKLSTANQDPPKEWF